MGEFVCKLIVFFAVLYVILLFVVSIMTRCLYDTLDGKAVAVVTHHDETTVYERTGSRAEFKYDYTYTVDDVEYSGESLWISEHYNDGTELEMRYSVSDPSVAMLSAENADTHYTIVSWIIVGALLLACAYFFGR